MNGRRGDRFEPGSRFERSVKMAKFRMLPRTSRIVALCSAANFINAADRVIMPIAIVPMTDEFKWNLYWQGWILSAFAFGYFTSQVDRDPCALSSSCVGR